jgi:hypothetical protein
MRRWDPLYSGGIISRCPERLSYNHAILLAGIREEDDAWLIRNSWGSGWGYDGYGYVLAGNTCGIADKGVLPIVPGASPMDSSY